MSVEYLQVDDFRVGIYVTIYSFDEAGEVFYICQVDEIGTADDVMVDENNHIIEPGRAYLTCSYLEKEDAKSTRKFVQYKKINSKVYVYPEEAFYVDVCLDSKLQLDINLYSIISQICMSRDRSSRS